MLTFISSGKKLAVFLKGSRYCLVCTTLSQKSTDYHER